MLKDVRKDKDLKKVEVINIYKIWKARGFTRETV